MDPAGGQLSPLEQPVAHHAGWGPMQREGQADFFPEGQLAARTQKWPYPPSPGGLKTEDRPGGTKED